MFTACNNCNSINCSKVKVTGFFAIAFILTDWNGCLYLTDKSKATYY